ncbi:MAG: hypothetical protein AB7D29_08870 [Campylobacterales bacterium]
MSAFFAEYARIIVFLHVFAAVIWVGGMIAVRLAVHPSLSIIDEKAQRLEFVIGVLNRFFLMISPSIVILGLTGIVMMLGLGFKSVPDLYVLVHVKTQIWTVMAIIYGVIYYRFVKAKKFFNDGELDIAAKYLAPLSKILIPSNIFLGLIALMLGVVLRGY